jgi:ABC-2 type transport system permease protein
MIVMVIPMVLWLPISRNPNGMFAQVVSFLPPISPFVMVVRLAGSEKIPFWQVPATIAIGVASMAFMAWAAAKIFRIGVLMYGKPPNFKTLVRWVRMA